MSNFGSPPAQTKVYPGLIIGLGIYYNSWWGLIALVPIIVALLGYCPLYEPCKISTCKK
ncbi:MAG: DUF2892 domain-containing protein [Thermodesulfobacteriota bacterium]|nr:DUF2892 domain-containing protein [Thermodesulfobacteriota bacterium]